MQALLTYISCSFSCLELSFSLTGDPFCGLAPRGEAVYLQSLRRHTDHMEFKVPSQAHTDNHTTRLVIFLFFWLKHTFIFFKFIFCQDNGCKMNCSYFYFTSLYRTSLKDLLIQGCNKIFFIKQLKTFASLFLITISSEALIFISYFHGDCLCCGLQ